MENENRRRVTSLRVRLSPDMMSRFEALASRYGMPPSTLAAFAVARFVLSEEANFSLARMAALDIARRSSERLDDLVDEGALQTAMDAAVHAILDREREKAACSVSSAVPQAAARPQRSKGETG